MSNEQACRRFPPPEGWREIRPRDRAAFQHGLGMHLLFEERAGLPLLNPAAAPAYLRRRVVATAAVQNISVRLARIAMSQYLVHARVRCGGREFKIRFQMEDGLIREQLDPFNTERKWLHELVSLTQIYNDAITPHSRHDLEDRRSIRAVCRNYQTRHYNTVSHDDDAHPSIQYTVQCEAHNHATSRSHALTANQAARDGRFCPACRVMPRVTFEHGAARERR